MSQIEKYLEQSPSFMPAVVGYLVQDDKVLLGLRKKVSLGLGENLISGIGGKRGDLEEFKDESDQEALVREFKEEVGISITEFRNVGKVRFIFPHKPKWNQDVMVYIITKWEDEPQETEAIKPTWFNLTDLPVNQMWDDNLYWLPKVLNGMSVNGVFFYDENSKVIEHELNEEKLFSI